MLTPEQQLFLASSPEFDAVLQDDPELKDLDACRIDYEREKDLLLDAFSGTWSIAGVPVRPITPAIWSVLWVMKSPFVKKNATVHVGDIAVFLYLLAHGVNGLDFDTLEEQAKEEGREWGLPEDADEILNELLDLVEIALAPLSMLPQTTTSSDDVVYDSDWLLSVCSVAARESGVTIQNVMADMPLSVVHGLLVVRARKAQPDKHYMKHSPDWVSKRELERVNALSEEFVKKHFKNSSASETADKNS